MTPGTRAPIPFPFPFPYQPKRPETGRAGNPGFSTPVYCSALLAGSLDSLISLHYAPLPVRCLSADGFRNYAGGVFSNTECGTLPTHAVLLVGYVERGANESWWLAKNSCEQGLGSVARVA